MNGKLLLSGTALFAAAPLAAAAEEGGESEPGHGALVEMEAITIPIIDGARLEGTLRFRLVLESHDDEAASRLAADLPGLRSEALAAGAEFSRLRASPFLAVDAHRLSVELTDALRARDDGIAKVLLVEVTARPS